MDHSFSRVALSLFNQFRLVYIQLREVISVATFALMSVGFIFSVCGNYATIRMQGQIPMPYYLFFPFLVVAVPVCIANTLPLAIGIYEGSSELLRRWRIQAKIMSDIGKRSQNKTVMSPRIANNWKILSQARDTTIFEKMTQAIRTPQFTAVFWVSNFFGYRKTPRRLTTVILWITQ